MSDTASISRCIMPSDLVRRDARPVPTRPSVRPPQIHAFLAGLNDDRVRQLDVGATYCDIFVRRGVPREQAQWHRLHRARGTCPRPTFTNGWAGGHHEQKNSKQESDRTVLTICITKALTKTTNCICRSKQSGGTRPKDACSSTCKFVPAT